MVCPRPRRKWLGWAGKNAKLTVFPSLCSPVEDLAQGFDAALLGVCVSSPRAAQEWTLGADDHRLQSLRKAQSNSFQFIWRDPSALSMCFPAECAGYELDLCGV